MTDDTTTHFDPWSGPPRRPEDDLVEDLPGEREPEVPDERDRRRRKVLRRVLIGSVALLALGLLGFVGGVWYLTNHFGDKIERIPDVFTDIPEAQRPEKPAGAAAEGVTFLLAGSDRRSDVATTGSEAGAPAWEPGLQRSDAIMLVRLNADRNGAYVVSIPRDSWVEIPGHGMNKINAAYSFGGPSLYIQTIENLTGIRIDHLAVVDWEGFKSLTDAVGGVTIESADGEETMDGEQALAYVRERYGLPAGDLDRVKRQQNYLRALMGEVLTRGTLTSPGKLNDLLNAIGDAVSVDDTLSNSDLRGLALDLRDLRGDNVRFLTAPVAGLGTEGEASVVYLDGERAPHLWRALENDDLQSYLDTYAGSNDELEEIVD